MDTLAARIEAVETNPDIRPDEANARRVCALALEAVEAGNFGVGAVLVDAKGRIAAEGHNEVFHPFFRSDRHAEMVTLDRFEDANPAVESMAGYALVVSLEPCPMCLVRLLQSGVGSVLHLSPDLEGGMVRRLGELPPFWTGLKGDRVFRQAEVSPEWSRLAHDIFTSNASDLKQRLLSRGDRQE